jgi:predicted Zn-dependent protease with MMP-like domain
VYELERSEFEAVVARSIDALPDDFRSQIANLEFSVEDWARPSDYGIRSPAGSVLLGVYRGVPLTRRGAHYNFALPDSIVIFQQPLQRLARDEDDLIDRITHVVKHEVAHYFGISDERLREIDAY